MTGDLNRYYDAVIAAVSDAESLLVFGPGEAKGEFHTRLAKLKPHAQVAAVETADKMSQAEMVAKVRAHFVK